MRESAANNKNTWGIKMSEIDIFGFIGMNRSVFATFFLCGVLMPLAVIIIAYLFRNFPTVVRAGAMVSALIGVVMLTVFSTAVQNGFFIAVSTLSEMAGNGSEIATSFGWMMALSLVQVVINLVLTVYVFLFAQWDNS